MIIMLDSNWNNEILVDNIYKKIDNNVDDI